MGPDGWDVLDGPSPPSGWRIEVHQGPLFGGTRTRRAVVPRPSRGNNEDDVERDREQQLPSGIVP
jgi:hypothetical protein